MVLSVVRSPLSVVQSLRRQTTGRLCLFANPGGDALANEQQRAIRTGKGALDQEQVALGVDLHQGVVAGRNLVHTHVAGHADALLGLTALTTPSGAGGDRTGRA